MMRFAERTVIVTGGGFGIGRGIARRFSEEGARVAILDSDHDRARETAGLLGALGGEAHAIKVDISDSGQVRTAVGEVDRRYGTADVLVNNAGIRFIRNVLAMPEEEWQRTISVNLTGIFHMVKAVAPAMLKRGKGRVVNVASMSGMLGQTGRAAYGASKAGIIQLTRSLAVELGPHVTVNAVSPGYIPGTGMMVDVDRDPKSSGWMVANTPARRPGTTEDVASAVAFLASDEASFITGVTLPVDGGFSSSKYMVEGKF